MKGVISQLLAFVKKPTNEKEEIPNTKKWGYFFACYLFSLVIILGVILLQESLSKFLGTDSLDHALMQSMPWWLFLLAGVVLAPAIEEFLFRFFLKYDRNFLFKLLGKTFSFDGEKFWAKSTWFWVYLSSVLFGLIHITNFSGEFKYPVLTILILTLPQIILGLVLAFLRLRLGFFWGVGFHAFWNLSLMLPMVLFLSKGISENIDKGAYKMEIEKHFFKQSKNSEITVTRAPDALIQEIVVSNSSPGRVFRNLFGNDEGLEPNEYTNTVNFTFENKGKISDDSIKVILKEIFEEKPSSPIL